MVAESISRRRILTRLAAFPALAATAAAAPDQPRYKLGVMAGMYASVPLDDTLTRIRKAGYRYISMAARQGKDVVYSPEMSKAERAGTHRYRLTVTCHRQNPRAPENGAK